MPLSKGTVRDLIAEHFPHQPTKDVATMCGLSVPRVQEIAYREMGLRKTARARAAAPYVRFERYWT